MCQNNTAASADSPFKTRVFENVVGEYDVFINQLEGKLPEELVGTLYRNGPAKWDAGSFHAGHVFDGDGMVSQFTFKAGKVRYRNRYIETPKYQIGLDESKKPVRGIGTQRKGGLLSNSGRPPADRANTHAIYHADKLLALSDDGSPWSIDPDDLSTLGRHDFDGELSKLSTFSPHPRIDPRTGEMFNFGLGPAMPLRHNGGKMPAALRVYRIDTRGKLSVLATVGLDRIYINHDFVITDNYIVFVLSPLCMSPGSVAAAGMGFITYDEATHFDDSLPTKIVLVPRNGGKPKIIELDPFVYVHFNNAYEVGSDLIVDLVEFKGGWESISTVLSGFRSEGSPPAPPGSLVRLQIRKNGQVTKQDLTDLLGEFPQHDWRRTSRRHRYSWFIGGSSQEVKDNLVPAAIVKVDHDNEKQTLHRFELGDIPGEPIYVPRNQNAAEDDGWLVGSVYLHSEHRSAVYVLDASDMEREPVVIGRLPHHSFPGFHGSFTRRIAS